jgi:murein endopeptidase
MRNWGTLLFAVLGMLFAGCMGAAPPDVADGYDPVDDPEYEDESEVEDVLADDGAADAMLVPIHAIGGQMKVCGASGLNQRSGPGTSYMILRTIPEDQVVTILAESGVWLRNDWNGNVGWSHKNYLCTVTTTPPMTSASESVLRTNGGSQRNSVHVPDHPGYVVAVTGRNAYYGTEETVFWIGEAFDVLAVERPGSPRPQVRDISVRFGGKPSGEWPHASHQSGRDADLTYPRIGGCSSTTGCPLQDVSTSSLDAAATWILFETWITNNVARRIFVDQSLHNALKQQARLRGHSEAKIQQWFGPLIQHVANHLNHFHVRFVCPSDDDDCIP